MSLDARLSGLWGRLQRRFDSSQQLTPENKEVIETIQPITNADELMQDDRIMVVSKASTGTGILTLGTINSSAKYRFLIKDWMIQGATANEKFNLVFITKPQNCPMATLEDSNTPTNIFIQTFAAGSEPTGPFVPTFVPEGLVLAPGDSIGINIGTFNAGATFYFYAIGKRELIF